MFINIFFCITNAEMENVNFGFSCDIFEKMVGITDDISKEMAPINISCCYCTCIFGTLFSGFVRNSHVIELMLRNYVFYVNSYYVFGRFSYSSKVSKYNWLHVVITFIALCCTNVNVFRSTFSSNFEMSHNSLEFLKNLLLLTSALLSF